MFHLDRWVPLQSQFVLPKTEEHAPSARGPLDLEWFIRRFPGALFVELERLAVPLRMASSRQSSHGGKAGESPVCSHPRQHNRVVVTPWGTQRPRPTGGGVHRFYRQLPGKQQQRLPLEFFPASAKCRDSAFRSAGNDTSNAARSSAEMFSS
jgi:hypothetical protein